MAMMIGEGTRAEINVTPLIDVLLVLLVIFLLINPRQPNGIYAEVPQQPKSPQQEDPRDRTVVLEVIWHESGGSSLRLNHEPVEWNELQARIADVYKTRAEKVLFLAGSKDLEFAEVARAIDLAKLGDPSLRVGLMPSSFAGD